VKYNANGRPQWVRQVDGLSTERGVSVQVDISDNLIAVFSVATTSAINLGDGAAGGIIPTQNVTKPAGANSTSAIIKYTSEGQFIWIRWFDAIVQNTPRSLTVDEVGSIYASI
jgi:hypothetical protein